MFVVTADQVGSRGGRDLVVGALRGIAEAVGGRLVAPAARTVGDELQAVTTEASAALDLVLLLRRWGPWSVGCGVGRVDLPLPDDTRAGSGPAFIAARHAVERAKKRPSRFALRLDPDAGLDHRDVEPLVDLLLAVRAGRTPQGWALCDILATGATQRHAAEVLGISAQAASQRAHAAHARLELEARPALERLLARSDVPAVPAVAPVPPVRGRP